MERFSKDISLDQSKWSDGSNKNLCFKAITTKKKLNQRKLWIQKCDGKLWRDFIFSQGHFNLNGGAHHQKHWC